MARLALGPLHRDQLDAAGALVRDLDHRPDSFGIDLEGAITRLDRSPLLGLDATGEGAIGHSDRRAQVHDLALIGDDAWGVLLIVRVADLGMGQHQDARLRPVLARFPRALW